jgi:ATP-dependent Lon protease
MLHPSLEPTPEEVDEYLEYAVEGRRRVKEQLNKRKPDDEFAQINLSFVRSSGEETVVYCPESRNALATQNPAREPGPGAEPAATAQSSQAVLKPKTETDPAPAPAAIPATRPQLAAKERHYRIHYGATGFSYETIFKDYLPDADEIKIEDPYIRAPHQIINFLRFCETAVRLAKPKRIVLVTNFDNELEKDEAMAKLYTIADSLKLLDVQLAIRINPRLHDREINLSNGWSIKIGRGFDIYQRPDDWLHIGSNDLDLRPCLETSVDIVRAKP